MYFWKIQEKHSRNKNYIFLTKQQLNWEKKRIVKFSLRIGFSKRNNVAARKSPYFQRPLNLIAIRIHNQLAEKNKKLYLGKSKKIIVLISCSINWVFLIKID